MYNVCLFHCYTSLTVNYFVVKLVVSQNKTNRFEIMKEMNNMMKLIGNTKKEEADYLYI